MYQIKAFFAAFTITMLPMLFCAYVLACDFYATVGQTAPLKEALTALWIAVIVGAGCGVFALISEEKITRPLLGVITIVALMSWLGGWVIYQL